MGAQAETQDRKTVLRHGGALPREAESERFNIDGLINGFEGVGGLFVGKGEEKAK